MRTPGGCEGALGVCYGLPWPFYVSCPFALQFALSCLQAEGVKKKQQEVKECRWIVRLDRPLASSWWETAHSDGSFFLKVFTAHSDWLFVLKVLTAHSDWLFVLKVLTAPKGPAPGGRVSCAVCERGECGGADDDTHIPY